jgi:hypothetical protein
MTILLWEPAPPRGRDDFELVRAGRDGTYWQSRDGLVVQLAGIGGGAAPDAVTQALHGALLQLACRDATQR